MTLLIINVITITLVIACMTAISPINLGALVLCIALSIASNIGTTATRWLGFITFIIYVGGLLVIFAYFAALQPNQFITRWNLFIIPSVFIITLITMAHLSSPVSWTSGTINIGQLYSYNNLIIPILIAIVLFLALIIVVKTSKADQGPLRPFFYVQTITQNSPRN